MLTSTRSFQIASRSKQAGVTLLITLIVLVAMTMAAISLMRSIDTTNIIAGNLAFQQAATHAADAGTEAAVNTLLPSLAANNQLSCSANCPLGYASFRQPLQEPPFVTWESYWAGVQARSITLATDALGNTVSYMVESLCDGNGQTGTCVSSPPSVAVSCSGSDLGAGSQQCIASARKYYRITSRVQGPRNAVSYIQAIVAM